MTPENIARLEQILNDHTNQIAALQANSLNNQSIAQSLQALQDAFATLTISAPSSRPKPVLPQPDKFTGQQYTWENWEASIKAKIRIDGPAIGGPEAQFYYVYDRLEGKIQSLVMPQLVQAEETKCYDVNALFAQLTRLYDDPNKVREAEDALHNLRQESDALGTYLAKFERLLYKSKANAWSDSAKIALLRKGLNNHYKQRLDTQLTLPDDYNGFVAVLQKLGKMRGHTGQSNGHTKSGGEPMDIGAISTIGAKQPSMKELLNKPDSESGDSEDY